MLSARLQPLLYSIIALLYVLNCLAIFHIGLSADGAHYALYGMHLSAGYVDHPPLIGWIQAFVLHVFHGHTISVHLVALLTSLGSLCLLYHLTRIVFPKRTTLFALACVATYFMAIVLNALTFLAMTQGPLIFFSLLSCLCLWHYLQKSNWSSAIALGLSLGCAALADYTAFLLALGFCLYCLCYAKHAWKQLSFYSALVLACICFSPFFIWNANHHWISFQSGYHHSFSGGFSWRLCLQMLMTQLLGYSPALVIFGLLGTIRAIRTAQSQPLLLAFPAMVIIGALSYAGCHQKMFFHWPALGWVLVIPLACDAIMHYWHCWMTKVIVFFSVLLTGLVYLLFYSQVLFGLFSFPTGRYPLNDLYGWSSIASHAVQLEHSLPSQTTQAELFVPNWSLASRLAWYAHQPVQILQTSPIAGYRQFVQWYGKPNQASSGILVVPYRWPHPNTLSHQPHTFLHCRFISHLNVIRHHHVVNQVDYYHCWDWIS